MWMSGFFFFSSFFFSLSLSVICQTIICTAVLGLSAKGVNHVEGSWRWQVALWWIVECKWWGDAAQHTSRPHLTGLTGLNTFAPPWKTSSSTSQSQGKIRGDYGRAIWERESRTYTQIQVLNSSSTFPLSPYLPEIKLASGPLIPFQHINDYNQGSNLAYRKKWESWESGVLLEALIVSPSWVTGWFPLEMRCNYHIPRPLWPLLWSAQVFRECHRLCLAPSKRFRQTVAFGFHFILNPCSFHLTHWFVDVFLVHLFCWKG